MKMVKKILLLKIVWSYLLVSSFVIAEEEELNVSVDLMTLAYEAGSLEQIYFGEKKEPIRLLLETFSEKKKYSGSYKIPIYLNADDEEPNTYVSIRPEWDEVILVTTLKGVKKLSVVAVGLDKGALQKKKPVFIFNAMDVPLYCLFDDERQMLKPRTLFDAGLSSTKKRTRLAIGVYSERDEKGVLLYSNRVRLWKDHSLFMIILKNNFDPNDEYVTDTSAIRVIQVNQYIGENVNSN